MRSRYLDVINSYFNREHPQAMPIFDSFGLDNDGRYYFDLENGSKAEHDRKSDAMDRIRWEWVEMMEKYGDQKLMYIPCPITSGIRPSKWIADQNEANNFDPEKAITTTHKVDRHMGGEVMYKSTVAPNVQDNLMRGALAAQRFPDYHLIMPVVREQGTKQMSQNPDLSNGDTYEGEEFMALWIPLVDYKKKVQHVPELLHSRNYIHEIMRAVQIQAGLHPSRPDADMDIPDMDGNDVDLIDIYTQLYETVRSQVGVGIAPREAATALAQMGDLFDHISGKRNNISQARKDAGMDEFPSAIHESWRILVSRDAAQFNQVREDATNFLKTFCLDSMDRREIDQQYEEWHQQGFGQPPAYSDGMHIRLRGKLRSIRNATQEINNFFSNYAFHRQDQDAAGLSADRETLIEHVEDLAHDYAAIRINNKNGHWNPDLMEIKAMVTDIQSKGKELEGASASNHDRIISLADGVRGLSDKIRNKVNEMIEDRTVINLRAEAKATQKKALELTGKTALKTTEPDVALHMSRIQGQMRRFSSEFDPFAKKNEPVIFDDALFDDCNDRERAGLPFALGGSEIVYPSTAQPFSARISFDAKSSGPHGALAAAAGVGSTKNIFGAAGEDSEALSKAALERASQIKEWFKTIRPGKMVHGSDNDAAVYDTVARHPNAVAKNSRRYRSSSAGYRWGSEARLLRESKFTQLRDDEVVFDHGWWQSEHQVQERVRCLEMQTGLLERSHGTNLRIYTAPEDLKNLPSNPEPDSLYESIAPLAKFIEQEFEAGRPVPANLSLGLIRMFEMHAMFDDPTIVKDRIKDPVKRFNAHTVEPSIASYLVDQRNAKIGGVKKDNVEDGLYAYFCDPHTGLLAEPQIIREIPTSALEEQALGLNYSAMQRNAKGKHSLGVTREPSENMWYIEPGMHA